MSICYQVSRFEKIDGKWQPTQDIGFPYETRGEAEEKLAETRKAFEVFAHHFQFGILEKPEPSNKPDPPLAKQCVVTDKFPRQHGRFSVFVNYTCPICSVSRRIPLDDVVGPGNTTVQCGCGENIRLNLVFHTEQGKPHKPEQQPVQGVQTKAGWTSFWGYSKLKH